jgi:hypothetical protein
MARSVLFREVVAALLATRRTGTEGVVHPGLAWNGPENDGEHLPSTRWADENNTAFVACQFNWIAVADFLYGIGPHTVAFPDVAEISFIPDQPLNVG